MEGKYLTMEDRGFDLNPEPHKDGITTKNYYDTFDPYHRGRMHAPQGFSWTLPFKLGKSITNLAVSKGAEVQQLEF